MKAWPSLIHIPLVEPTARWSPFVPRGKDCGLPVNSPVNTRAILNEVVGYLEITIRHGVNYEELIMH